MNDWDKYTKKEKRLEEEELKKKLKEESYKRKLEEEQIKYEENKNKRKLQEAAEEEELERLFMLASNGQPGDGPEMEINSTEINDKSVASNFPEINLEFTKKVTNHTNPVPNNPNNELYPAFEESECFPAMKETSTMKTENTIDMKGKSFNEKKEETLPSNSCKKSFPDTMDFNVWSAIRNVKESNSSEIDLKLSNSGTGEVLDTDSLDIFIQELRDKAARKKEQVESSKRNVIVSPVENKLECIEEESPVTEKENGVEVIKGKLYNKINRFPFTT